MLDPAVLQMSAGSVDNADDAEEQDNRKAGLPYVVGFEVTAMRHHPPEPFGLGCDTQKPPKHHGWRTLSQLDYCLVHSPLEGRTVSEDRKRLAITSVLRTGDQRGAQLVIMNDAVVAKVSLL